MKKGLILIAILFSAVVNAQVSVVRAMRLEALDSIISRGVIYTNKENAHAIILRPSNYGTSYGPYGVAGDFRIGWDNNYINPASGRPDVVGMMWGYNTLTGGGRINTSEAAFSFRTETHYETGGQRLFEFHMPAFVDSTGLEHRLMSWYTPKSGVSSGGPRLETTEFQLMKWRDQNTSWAGFASGRLTLNVYEKATSNFPEILLGSLADSINGTTLPAANFYTHIRATGGGMNIGLNNNAASLGNPAVRTQFDDNVWVGVQPGYGGNSNTQRDLFVAGRIVGVQSANGNALDIDKTAGTGVIASLKAAGVIITNISSAGIDIANGKYLRQANLHITGPTATTTTDATTTTVQTILTTNNSGGIIEVWLVGKRTASNEFITGKKILRYKNNSNVLTLGTATSILADEIDAGLAGASWTITTSGANILVRVTGIAATNIVWTPQVQVVTSNSGIL